MNPLELKKSFKRSSSGFHKQFDDSYCIRTFKNVIYSFTLHVPEFQATISLQCRANKFESWNFNESS